jgi:hypothetical protein
LVIWSLLYYGGEVKIVETLLHARPIRDKLAPSNVSAAFASNSLHGIEHPFFFAGPGAATEDFLMG